MISFGGMIFNGVFDKFPNVKFGFMEGGVAWFLVCLERFDRSWETHIQHDPRKRFLELRPKEKVSEYIARHIDAGRIFVGCEGEEPDIAHAVRRIGNKPWGSSPATIRTRSTTNSANMKSTNCWRTKNCRRGQSRLPAWQCPQVLQSRSARTMTSPRSIGLIIPSSNRLTEPQFNTYAPAGVGVHVTRLRMTGKFRKPLSELKRPLTEAAQAISDVKPGVIVFHCTANSMESGLAHEKALVEIIEEASGCPTITTAQAITQAFDQSGIKKLVLISPYVQSTNQLEVTTQRKPVTRCCTRWGSVLNLRQPAGHAASVESCVKKIAGRMSTAIF